MHALLKLYSHKHKFEKQKLTNKNKFDSSTEFKNILMIY